MPNPDALKVAVLWHMHQPDYREPQSNRLALPWVRLHALKDYLDMPLLAAEHERIRVNFNLVPSLLDQLQLYLDGGTDRHLELSRFDPLNFSDEQKQELLGSFFLGHPPTMIDPYPRYRELYRKHRSNLNASGSPSALFSTQELRDIQVWSNLVWIDPLFREESPVAELLSKQRHFTEEQKHRLLDWELDLIGRIVPQYRTLQENGRIEISFTPYYHPILPLLCDTDAALESLPELKLPENRFRHPEDAAKQITMAIEKYRELFGREMRGMWPSEGSISEEVLDLVTKAGVTWVASDEEVLHHSLRKSGSEPVMGDSHRAYRYGKNLSVFFRDHHLSDRIGFVYSTWDAERAAADFIDHLLELRTRYEDDLENVIVPIILDGENAWEYFAEDGLEFLRSLYNQLAKELKIETVLLKDASEQVSSRPLKAIQAGSWINHNFRIWIGHSEDNESWDLLSKTREALTKFERTTPGFSPAAISDAWEQIYRAEGSDWNWWYGDEHRGADNEDFDRIYRAHLIAVYDLLGLDIPVEFLKPILNVRQSVANFLPNGLISPIVDGHLTQFYEWSGAGFFDCTAAGGSMHQVDQVIRGIHYGFDRESVFIRVDFGDLPGSPELDSQRLEVTLFTPDRISLEIPLKGRIKTDLKEGMGRFAFDKICEICIDREKLWTSASGEVSITTSLWQGADRIELWPDNGSIEMEVPEPGKEVFWPI